MELIEVWEVTKNHHISHLIWGKLDIFEVKFKASYSFTKAYVRASWVSYDLVSYVRVTKAREK